LIAVPINVSAIDSLSAGLSSLCIWLIINI
jgi:hypothetical protein